MSKHIYIYAFSKLLHTYYCILYLIYLILINKLYKTMHNWILLSKMKSCTLLNLNGITVAKLSYMCLKDTKLFLVTFWMWQCWVKGNFSLKKKSSNYYRNLTQTLVWPPFEQCRLGILFMCISLINIFYKISLIRNSLTYITYIHTHRDAFIGLER